MLLDNRHFQVEYGQNQVILWHIHYEFYYMWDTSIKTETGGMQDFSLELILATIRIVFTAPALEKLLRLILSR